MQLATPPTRDPAPAIAPGSVLGHGLATVVTTGGIQYPVSRIVEITAGDVLMSGIKDIRAGAQELIRRGGDGSPFRHRGLVAFVRNGDVFDAVTMLAPRYTDGSSRSQIWAPWDVKGFNAARSADIAAIWQISDYGFDTNYGTPNSMFPAVDPQGA